MPFQQGGIAWNKGTKGVCKSNGGSFKIGNIPWNKGIPVPKESIKKMRDGLRIWCEEGGYYPNWKGGISRAYKNGYYSIAYKRWRKEVFERDNYSCQECGAQSGIGKYGYLTPHHIKSFAKYPELRYEVSNGITLCEDCHSLVDKYRARFKREVS
jgi:hypothetical protein